MLGIAQKLFLASGGSFLESPLIRWPFINQLVQAGWIGYTDLLLAQELLKSVPNAHEDIALFIIHLSSATRQGHLCVKIKEQEIFPSPKNCWLAAENQALSDSLSSSLTKQIVSGANQLPQEIVNRFGNDKKIKPIYQFKDLYYFQKYWRYESQVIENIQRLEQISPSLTIDSELVCKKILETKLLPEQSQAIQTAITNSLMLICGGPGTGKTHTAGQLIKIFWEVLQEQKDLHCEIVLTAPTGKAATNLEQSLRKAFGASEKAPSIQAKTLHALLGLRPNRENQFLDNEIRQIHADIILVDECSMIDIELFNHLLSAIKPGARLILLGDRFQLPPIGAGSPFANLLTYYQQKKSECAVELKQCLRTDLKSIVDVANGINHGDSSPIFSHGGPIKQNCVHYRQIETNKKAQQSLLEYSLPFFHQLNAKPFSDHELITECNRFRILSPLRQGLFGVDTLNELLKYKIWHSMQGREWYAAPIIIVQNDYKLDLFNGDVGVLVRRVSKDSEKGIKQGDFALFPGKMAQEIRRIPALILPKYEHGYCLSVHKSQGSEFDHVLIMMPQGAETFGREMFYTAVTRARKQLDIWGDDQVINQTIKMKSMRLSGE